MAPHAGTIVPGPLKKLRRSPAATAPAEGALDRYAATDAIVFLERRNDKGVQKGGLAGARGAREIEGHQARLFATLLRRIESLAAEGKRSHFRSLCTRRRDTASLRSPWKLAALAE